MKSGSNKQKSMYSPQSIFFFEAFFQRMMQAQRSHCVQGARTRSAKIVREMFIHELSIQCCTIVYSTGLHDERKQPSPQGVPCSINCVLPTSKSFYQHLPCLSLR